ncbi:hypothetical protein D3C78_709860 [compost metagenome]
MQQAGGGRQDRQLLAFAVDHLSAGEWVAAGQRQTTQFDPALGIGQGIQIFVSKRGHLPWGVLQPQRVVRQRLAGGPGCKQLRFRLSLGLGFLSAGLLFQVHGVEHQKQSCDKGHRIDGPEFVFQGDIAKPGTHGRSSLIERKHCWQGAIIVPKRSAVRLDMRQTITGRPKKARAHAVEWAASCSAVSPRCKATSRSTSVR